MVRHVVTADARVIPVGHEDRSVRCHADVAGTEPRILAREDVLDRGIVARARLRDRIGPHHARSGVAVDELVLEDFRQQLAFVDCNAGGRTCAGLQQVGHDSRIVEMPVTLGNLALPSRALLTPARAGQFVAVAEIAVLHHVVDADALVAVIVVVGLPNGAERIHRQFIVVAEVVSQDLDPREVLVQSECEALPIGFAAGDDLVALGIDDQPAIGRVQLPAVIAHVEVEFSVGAKDECMDAVIVIHALDASEDDLGRTIGLKVAVLVLEQEDVG